MVKQDGRKMSKSSGNAVDLSSLLDRHGADVLRLAILSSAAPDQDINWSDDLLIRSARFIRALRSFFGRHSVEFASLPATPPRESKAQRRLAAWVETAERKVTGSLSRYAFHLVIQQLTFLLEQIDKFDRAAEPADKVALACASSTLLKLLAPIAPHIAEELWESCGGAGLLATATWPLNVADGSATPVSRHRKVHS
jgi:leucyl-tRNA synthetase